eukprot:scaffold44_cov411-Prasinococcus_capsulatus_cf.AAC.39
MRNTYQSGLWSEHSGHALEGRSKASTYIQASNTARISRGLPLGVIEVGRHGDDRSLYFLSYVSLGVTNENTEDLR